LPVADPFPDQHTGAEDVKAVNSYARSELLDAAGVLDRIGARQAGVIREALR
jgi:hypothetical protein